MSSRSFKAAFVNGEQFHPPPPSPTHYIEPLSPPLTATLYPSEFPAPNNRERDLSSKQRSRHHGGYKRENNKKRGGREIAVNITSPPHYPNNRPTSARSQGSPIDTLATVALSTSPNFDSDPRWRPGVWTESGHGPAYSSQVASNRIHGSYNNYAHPDERPSKRARSEILPSPEASHHNARPATSHNGTVGWSYNVEHMVKLEEQSRARGDRPQLTGHFTSDPARQQMEDAALLLSLSSGTSFSRDAFKRPRDLLIPRSKPSVDFNPPASAPASSSDVTFLDKVKETGPPSSLNNLQRRAAEPLGDALFETDVQHTNVPNVNPHYSGPANSLRIRNLERSLAGAENATAFGNGSATVSSFAEPGRALYADPGGGKQTNGDSLKIPTSSASTSAADVGNHWRAEEKFAYSSQTRPTSSHSFLAQPELLQEVISRSRRYSAEEATRDRNISDHIGAEAERWTHWSSDIPASRIPIETGRREEQKTTTAPLKHSKAKDLTVCAACKLHANSVITENEDWISCNGCKEWFHFACAGFNNEREVRNVDKFFCRGCKPKFGPTTFVRKSTRAHTVVDYAGLNEGVLGPSGEGFEHHYIKSIKDGTFKFRPETFPRMRPELITSEYFERCEEMSQPIVIPAEFNPRPRIPGTGNPGEAANGAVGDGYSALLDTLPEEEDDMFDFEYVADDGQDKLDMVIPQGLTVRRVAEMYGLEEKVEVIDVKSQEGGDKRWNMRKWADYYEQEGEKPVRNVISLEVSTSKLGRLIRRPKIVRDLDLQDAVWPKDERSAPPAVQFYCLMSVADCYTDFHIDFGGSSVYYHILKGKKTFFFIPPTKQHLKKYEEWCLSPAQNWTFLPDQTNECYRVDLSEGDTMLIPSGWIHAVWTPENSLVIGGNFLTPLHYGMQIRVFEIEKATKVPRKFRYPFFQKVLWYAVIKYLREDPLPPSVAQTFFDGKQFHRTTPIYLESNKFGHNSDPGPELYNARFYSKPELDGLPELAQYIFRTVMISLGRVEGVTTDARNTVGRSIPKGHGEPLEIVKTFALWAAWKRGNEDIPQWAHPDAVLPEHNAAEKKLSAAALKRLDRQAAIDAYRIAPDRQSARQRTKALEAPKHVEEFETVVEEPALLDSNLTNGGAKPVSTPKSSVLGPKRIACDACRKRRIRCKHKDDLLRTISPKREDPSYADQSSPTLARQSDIETLVSMVIPSSPQEDRKPPNGIQIDAAPSQVQTKNRISSDGGQESLESKRGRTKACLDCRKSKRRCIHDEYGNVDPVKAQEVPVPRGVAKGKKKRPSGEKPQSSRKRSKSEHEPAISADALSNEDNVDEQYGFDAPPQSPLTPERIRLIASSASMLNGLQSAADHEDIAPAHPPHVDEQARTIESSHTSVIDGQNMELDDAAAERDPGKATNGIPTDAAREALSMGTKSDRIVSPTAQVASAASREEEIPTTAGKSPTLQYSARLQTMTPTPKATHARPAISPIDEQASPRQSTRQSRPVDRFRPTSTPSPVNGIAIAAEVVATQSANRRPSATQQRQASNSGTPSTTRFDKSHSPETLFSADPARRKRSGLSGTPESTRKAPIGGGSNRRRSTTAMESPGSASRRREKSASAATTEPDMDDPSMKLAKMLAGSDFGLRRR